MCINTVENILKLRGIVDVAAEHFYICHMIL